MALVAPITLPALGGYEAPASTSSTQQQVPPDAVLLVGAQKAGTTALAEALAACPCANASVRFQLPRAGKEAHVFDNDDERRATHWSDAFDLQREEDADTTCSEQQQEKRCQQRWLLDATPSYLRLPKCAPRAARAFGSVGPRAVVAVLRDPIARAISSFHHHFDERLPNVGPEVYWTMLDALLDAELRAWRECTSHGNVSSSFADPRAYEACAAADASPRSPESGRPLQLVAAGWYPPQLAIWRAAFPRTPLIVVTEAAMRQRGSCGVASAIINALIDGGNKDRCDCDRRQERKSPDMHHRQRVARAGSPPYAVLDKLRAAFAGHGESMGKTFASLRRMANALVLDGERDDQTGRGECQPLLGFGAPGGRLCTTPPTDGRPAAVMDSDGTPCASLPNGQRLCWPNVLVPGQKRAGTTAFHAMFAQHPSVRIGVNGGKGRYFLGGGPVPGTSIAPIWANASRPPYVAGVGGWAEGYPTDVRHGEVVVDVSPGDAYGGHAHGAPDVTAAYRARSLLPWARAVLLLREPVARAWSALLHYAPLREARAKRRGAPTPAAVGPHRAFDVWVRTGVLPECIDIAITEEEPSHLADEESTGDDQQQQASLACLSNAESVECAEECASFDRAHPALGFSDLLVTRAWLDAFGDDRVLVILQEELLSDAERVLRRVDSFLGLDTRVRPAPDIVPDLNGATASSSPWISSARLLRRRLAPCVALLDSTLAAAGQLDPKRRLASFW